MRLARNGTTVLDDRPGLYQNMIDGSGPALVGGTVTHARTIFRGKNFEFKLFFRGENIEQVNTIF